MGPLSGSNQAVINQGNWNEDPPFSGHNNIGQLLDTQLETSAFNAYHPVKLIFVILFIPCHIWKLMEVYLQVR